MMKNDLPFKYRLRFPEELTDDVKYPISLPKSHPVTQLIVKYHRGREGYKNRLRGKFSSQQMAPLTKVRLELTMKPFINCSVDFAWHFLIKQERGWLFLFADSLLSCWVGLSLELDGFFKLLREWQHEGVGLETWLATMESTSLVGIMNSEN